MYLPSSANPAANATPIIAHAAYSEEENFATWNFFFKKSINMKRKNDIHASKEFRSHAAVI